ncbi:MAG: PKD domain-containing protein, partial [Acidobacteriota bacterium]
MSILVVTSCGTGGGGGGSGGEGSGGGTTANHPPTADAGADQSVTTGAHVTLDGTASSDPDGDLLAYRWSFTARPAGSKAELADVNAVMPTFVADRDGSYVISLVVNDGTVDSAADSVTVTAATGNSAPVANAGPDQNVATGAQVTLDGSASSDADGDVLTYAWSFTAKPAGSAAQLSSATSATPTFTADVVGTYVVSLVVDDGVLASAADTVTVSATTIVPGQCAFIHEGLIGRGGALLPDGRIVTIGSTGGVESELRRYASDLSGGERLALFPGVANDIAAQADGRVLVTGRYMSALSGEDLMLRRFDSDGTPDSSFGAGGTVMFDGGLAEAGGAIAVQQDGKIVVAGYSHAFDYAHGEVLLLRYNSNGTLDTSFGTDGVVILTPGGKAGVGVAVGRTSVEVGGETGLEVGADRTARAVEVAGSLRSRMGGRG